jgi:hypothetical protein
MIDNLVYSGMVGQDWTVRWVDSTNFVGMAQYDTIRFTQNMDIERWSQGTLIETWASSCLLQNGEIIGTSLHNEGFRVYRDDTGQLVCNVSVPSSQQRKRLLPLAIGTVLGTLAGAATGVAAGSPLLGMLIGFSAALVSSLATQASSGALGTGARTGSGATWVAEEGGANRAAAPSRFPTSMRA